MKKNSHNVDRFFQEALGDFNKAPSASVWAALENNFFPEGGGKTVVFTILTSIFLLLGTSMGTYWVLSQDHYTFDASQHMAPLSNSNPASAELIVDTTPQQTIETSQNENPNHPNINHKVSNHTTFKPENNNSSPLIENDNNLEQEDVFLASLSTVYTDDIFNAGTSVTTEINRYSLNQAYYMNGFTYAKISDPTSINSSINPELRDPNLHSAIDFNIKDDYAKKANLGMGLHFTPAVIFYDVNPAKNTYSGDITLNYINDNFTVQLGAGINKTNDVGKYKINYTSEDSVGYYREVTSFSFDQDNPDSVIVNYQQTVVFDSIPHYSLVEKNNSYTYFQVPLTLGYKFYNSKRFHCSVKLGMIYSLLIDKYEPTVEYNAISGSLENIERQVPARFNSNWMLTAGINIGFMLNDKIVFSIEPYYGQYLNSVYQNNPEFDNKKPFVIGVRTGFDLNF